MDNLKLEHLYPATIEVNGEDYYAGLMTRHGVPLFSYRDAGLIEAMHDGASRHVSHYSLMFPGHYAFYEVHGVEVAEVSEEVYGADDTPVPVFGKVYEELGALHELLAEAYDYRATEFRV